jgi:hypothetical protein
MVYSTSNTLSLQPLLFDSQDFSSCFFRKPSERELEFLSLYGTIQQLLSHHASAVTNQNQVSVVFI